MASYFGKLCATERSPSTVDKFNFWVARGHADKVEVGYIVTAENRENHERVFGLVTDIQFFTDAESVLIDYFSHEFGSPMASPPTERQQIHIASAAVIGARPYRARPMSSGVVRLATAQEIHQAYGMDQIKNRIFCGVITNGPDPDNWAPAFMDEKFLLGPEGAHLNISGASGLATKTSAAIFLISSVLSAAEEYEKKYAVLAFNVKGGDLLRIGRGGEDDTRSQQELLEIIKTNGSVKAKKMLSFVEESKVEMCFKKSKLKMYAPARADDILKPNSLVQEDVKPFYWALSDILKEEAPVRFTDLFESENLDDKAIGVLARIEELLDDGAWKGRVASFRHLVQEMANSMTNKSIWHAQHHSTVAKVFRHVKANCEGILKGLFAYDEEEGNDIKIENIAPGELWIVDIEAINDRAKRLVFYNLTTRLANLMEIESLKPKKERRLDGIIVFVDELNKFAPTGAGGRSRIKEQIINLAARGRSLGVILFGAEQFASRVDKEVIGNASSHLLGRTELVELQDRAYGWLSKELRFIVSNLEKGRLLLRHATYSRPVFISFPQPLHTYSENAIKEIMERGVRKADSIKCNTDAENKFKELRGLLKGHKGIHPAGIYKDVPAIGKLGTSQDKFSEWYRCWVNQDKYRGRGATEKNAMVCVIEYLGSLKGI